MGDIDIRITGQAGRITLTRPQALNAMSYPMMQAIEAAIEDWAGNPTVALVVIDAAGERAFCSGGDIADLYATGKAGDFAYGQRFWREEYRLNERLANYPKPIVAFMQGFTMGGGVGIGCHSSHRVVGNTSRIAMPECGIGLVPDVGGSLMLATGPGRLGEYLGLTAARMEAGDAIVMGFADHYLPEAAWPALIERLEATGDASEVLRAARPAPAAPLAAHQDEIDAAFRGRLGDIAARLAGSDTDFAAQALKALRRNSPLSMACTLHMLDRLRASPTIRAALAQEYRFTFRAMEHGDFLEGIRAQIIDRDRNPRWKHGIDTVTQADVAAMMAPLGENELTWED